MVTYFWLGLCFLCCL